MLALVLPSLSALIRWAAVIGSDIFTSIPSTFNISSKKTQNTQKRYLYSMLDDDVTTLSDTLWNIPKVFGLVYRQQHTLTIVHPFGFFLQGHARCIGFYASFASTGTLRAIEWHHDVAQLSCAESTSMYQLVLMDNSPSDTFKKTKPLSYFKMSIYLIFAFVKTKNQTNSSTLSHLVWNMTLRYREFYLIEACTRNVNGTFLYYYVISLNPYKLLMDFSWYLTCSCDDSDKVLHSLAMAKLLLSQSSTVAIVVHPDG